MTARARCLGRGTLGYMRNYDEYVPTMKCPGCPDCPDREPNSGTGVPKNGPVLSKSVMRRLHYQRGGDAVNDAARQHQEVNTGGSADRAGTGRGKEQGGEERIDNSVEAMQRFYHKTHTKLGKEYADDCVPCLQAALRACPDCERLRQELVAALEAVKTTAPGRLWLAQRKAHKAGLAEQIELKNAAQRACNVAHERAERLAQEIQRLKRSLK